MYMIRASTLQFAIAGRLPASQAGYVVASSGQ